jgi:hypothetical protein
MLLGKVLIFLYGIGLLSIAFNVLSVAQNPEVITGIVGKNQEIAQ